MLMSREKGTLGEARRSAMKPVRPNPGRGVPDGVAVFDVVTLGLPVTLRVPVPLNVGVRLLLPVLLPVRLDVPVGAAVTLAEGEVEEVGRSLPEGSAERLAVTLEVTDAVTDAELVCVPLLLAVDVRVLVPEPEGVPVLDGVGVILAVMLFVPVVLRDEVLLGVAVVVALEEGVGAMGAAAIPLQQYKTLRH